MRRAAPRKRELLTSVNMGKVYFTAWSMDVKIEGENVVRHLDLTTHNHASVPGNTPPWPFMDAMAVAQDPAPTEKANEESACKNPPPKSSTYKKKDGTTGVKLRCSPKCREAKACRLVAKENDKGNAVSRIIPAITSSKSTASHRKAAVKRSRRFPSSPGYDHEKAPTACARNPGALKGMKNNHNAMQAWRRRQSWNVRWASTARKADR